MPLLCPNCKVSTSFKGTVHKEAVFSTNDDEIFIEKEDEDFSVIIKSCELCKTIVTHKQLLKAERCDRCENIVPVNKIVVQEDEHICIGCYALDSRPELNEMTPQQLVMRILELEDSKRTTEVMA